MCGAKRSFRAPRAIIRQRPETHPDRKLVRSDLRERALQNRALQNTQDMTDIAADVLRHRLVLSYDALAEGVTADDIVRQVLAAVPAPDKPFDSHVQVPAPH